MKIRLTKEFRFEMAHSLKDYDGPCKNVHGHSYILEITVIGEPSTDESSPKLGMVVDFKELKKIYKEEIFSRYDHSYVLNKKGADYESLAKTLDCEKIVLADYQPTCENMVCDFAQRIKAKLPSHVQLFRVKLHETATSFAEWFASDNE